MGYSIELYNSASIVFLEKASNKEILYLKYGRFLHFSIMYYFGRADLSFIGKGQVNYVDEGVVAIYDSLVLNHRHNHYIEECEKLENEDKNFRFFYLLLLIEEEVLGKRFKNKLRYCELFSSFFLPYTLKIDDLDKISRMQKSLSRELLLLFCPALDSEKIMYSDLPSDHEIDLEALHEYC